MIKALERDALRGQLFGEDGIHRWCWRWPCGWRAGRPAASGTGHLPLSGSPGGRRVAVAGTRDSPPRAVRLGAAHLPRRAGPDRPDRPEGPAASWPAVPRGDLYRDSAVRKRRRRQRPHRRRRGRPIRWMGLGASLGCHDRAGASTPRIYAAFSGPRRRRWFAGNGFAVTVPRGSAG